MHYILETVNHDALHTLVLDAQQQALNSVSELDSNLQGTAMNTVTLAWSRMLCYCYDYFG